MKIKDNAYFKKLKQNNFQIVFDEGNENKEDFKFFFKHNYLFLKIKENLFFKPQKNFSFYLFDKETGLKSDSINLFLQNPFLSSKEFFLKFFFLFLFMAFTFFTVFLILLIALQYEKPEIIIESRNFESKVLSDSIINWSKSSISDQKTEIENTNTNLKFDFKELHDIEKNSDSSEKEKFIINEIDDNISVISNSKKHDSRASFFDGIQFK